MGMGVLEGQRKLVDAIRASTRRGLNRVTWTMQHKPPRVPRAATVTNWGSRGPRVMPGTYTVRLRKGDKAVESRIEIALDRRAPSRPMNRARTYAPPSKVLARFATMGSVSD